MSIYDEHGRQLKRQLDALWSEYHGFLQAKLGPCLRWSPDLDIQTRFEKGYWDGKSNLAQDAHVARRKKEGGDG